MRLSTVLCLAACAELAACGDAAAPRRDVPELDDSPAWSPDGRRIVFRSYRSMRADGSDVRRVTREEAWGGGLNPAWRRTDR